MQARLLVGWLLLVQVLLLLVLVMMLLVLLHVTWHLAATVQVGVTWWWVPHIMLPVCYIDAPCCCIHTTYLLLHAACAIPASGYACRHTQLACCPHANQAPHCIC